MVLSFDAMFVLITAFSVITSLLTQFAKVILDTFKAKYASNVVVLVMAVLVGTVGTSLYYVNYQIPFNALTSVYLAIMCLLNAAGAMVGYDKVQQLLKQLKELRIS